MTNTPYTPEDLGEDQREPDEAEIPDAEPVEHDNADDFDPGSPAADAPAIF